jgi:hypothetical protein
VVTGPLPTLYDCFDHADLLISDISSVAADFIASGKPYAVANPEDRDEDEFRAEFPTVAAAYLLDADCAALPDVITEVSGPGPDRLMEARRELKGYLLGRTTPTRRPASTTPSRRWPRAPPGWPERTWRPARRQPRRARRSARSPAPDGIRPGPARDLGA